MCREGEEPDHVERINERWSNHSIQGAGSTSSFPHHEDSRKYQEIVCAGICVRIILCSPSKFFCMDCQFQIIIIIITSSYIALFTPERCLFRHYYPLSLGLKSFLKLSQLPGEYTACATIICRLNQSQEPLLPSQVHTYPWVERSNYS